MSAVGMPMPPPPGAGRGRSRPRWGVQTGLMQPGMFAFWLYLMLVSLGILYAVLVHLAAVIISPAGWALSLVLLVLYIVPVALVVRWVDLYEREPRSMVLGAFLWGALVAPLFAGLGNDVWGVVVARLGGGEFAWQWSAALTAPPIEEIYKYLGIVVLYLIARLEFDDLVDGFVYGALVGLGFAVAEDVFYFIFVFGGDVPSVLEGFFVRVIASGLYGHVTFTGIAGIGLAYFVTHRAERPFARRLAVAAGLLLLAMAAHFVWNSPFLHQLPILLYGVVKGLPFLIGLAVLVVLARRREHQALGDLLSSEVGQAGLTEREVGHLRDRRARHELDAVAARGGGGEAVRALKQLRSEDVRLAMVASAVDRPDDARLIEQRGRGRALRSRLVRLAGVGAALGLTPEASASLAEDAPPFAPDRVVGATGAWAWATPDQADPTRMGLAPLLPLQVLEQRGDWLLVRSQSGWHGWTGAPYLTLLRLDPLGGPLP